MAYRNESVSFGGEEWKKMANQQLLKLQIANKRDENRNQTSATEMEHI